MTPRRSPHHPHDRAPQLCGADCRYRLLYEGAQTSLSDMAGQHAAAINRVVRLRAGLIEILKVAFPGGFATAEARLGSRVSDVDDELVLSITQALIDAAADSANPRLVGDLRNALAGRGIHAPGGAGLAELIDAVRNTPTTPTSAGTPAAGRPVPSGVGERRGLGDRTAAPVGAAPAGQNDTLADLFADLGSADPGTGPTTDGAGPLDEPPLEDLGPVGGGHRVFDDDPGPSCAPVPDDFEDDLFDDLFDELPNLAGSDPFDDLFDELPDLAGPATTGTSSGPGDDCTESVTAPAALPAPAPAQSPFHAKVAQTRAADRWPAPEGNPVIPLSSTPPAAPLVTRPDDEPSLAALFGDDVPSAPSRPKLTRHRYPTLPDGETTSAVSSGTSDQVVEAAAPETNDPAPLAETAAQPNLAGMGGSLMKPEMPAAKKPARRKTRGGRAEPRSSRVAAQPPEDFGADGDDVSVSERLLAAVAVPRPMFLTDLEALAGEEAAERWTQEMKAAGGTAPVRFLNPKPRHKKLGPLVLPHEWLRTAATEFTRNNAWVAAINTYKGAVAYEVAVLLRRLGDQVIGYRLYGRVLQLRLNTPQGTVGMVVVAEHDPSDPEVRKDLAAALDGLVIERHVQVVIASCYAEPVNVLPGIVLEEAERRQWNPAMPVVACRSWDYGHGVPDQILGG